MFNNSNITPAEDRGLECSPIPGNVKTPGIYDIMKDTSKILIEVSQQLRQFSDEIMCRDDNCGEVKPHFEDPNSFIENVFQVHALAIGIRGDLESIMSKFR